VPRTEPVTPGDKQRQQLYGVCLGPRKGVFAADEAGRSAGDVLARRAKTNIAGAVVLVPVEIHAPLCSMNVGKTVTGVGLPATASSAPRAHPRRWLNQMKRAARSEGGGHRGPRHLVPFPFERGESLRMSRTKLPSSQGEPEGNISKSPGSSCDFMRVAPVRVAWCVGAV